MAFSIKLKLTKDFLINTAINIFYTLLGCAVFIVLFIYAVLSSPIFLYRFVLTKYIAPTFRPPICKAVTVLGQFMATEFIPKHKTSSELTQLTLNAPRCAIVVNTVFQGEITNEEAMEGITEGWFKIKNGESELRYPEFQQYIEQWMGFMFFKQDTNFSLQNHIYHHTIPDETSHQDCEKHLCNFIETLLNKSFHVKRSPWEIHFLHNYKNPLLGSDSGETDNKNFVVVYRFHHGMVDGLSILHALVEGIAGGKLPSMEMPTPQKIERIRAKRGGFCSESLTNFKKWTYIFWRTLYDAGYLALLERLNKNGGTPWHCPDEKKKWKQLYCRSGLIPVEKIKFVKSHLGVSFTGTLLSLIAAGSSENFKVKGSNKLKRIPVGTVVPLPGHPNKLRNHAIGTLLELNVSQNMDPVERLQNTDDEFREARHFSQLPYILLLVAKLFSSSVAPVAKYFCKNKFIPAALTNFPGPGLKVEFMGRKCLAMDACIGGLDGVVGVVFSVISYHGNLRISVTAENGIMERQELEELVKSIESELDTLYDRANEIKKLGKRGDDGELYRPNICEDLV